MNSWNSSVPLCQWTGVTCSGNGQGQSQRVSSLVLDSVGLGGTLSPSLGNLTSLTTLRLPNNKLSGEIPPSLGDLSSLTYLNLSSNALSGTLPPSIANLSQLQVLVLANNSLAAAIPPALANLLNLTHLNLSHNRFAGGISPSLGKLRYLTTLDLSSNNLTGDIPPSLGNLSSLSTLQLSNNVLNGVIPPSLGNLSHLTTLDLSTNYLDGGLPEALGQLKSLVSFKVSQNGLSGAIPISLYNITTLKSFTVSSNYNLSGELPPDIGLTLPNLQILTAYENQLEGPIPISLANASGLEKIDISYNQFTGRIPPNLGMLKSLRWLALENNYLEAKEASDWDFLSSLANCTELNFLALDTNRLVGNLPNSISNLPKSLTWLSLWDNQLTGSIPSGIGNLVNLSTLGLKGNNFSGSIPTSFCQLTNLEALILFQNQLSGEILPCLGNLTRLNELYLDKNQLQGEIPASIGSCLSLTTLDLSHNRLTGPIPKELLSLPSLSIFLSLSNNLLSGPLPVEVGNLQNLGYMNISNNNLSAQIPDTLGYCQLLENLYMSHNSFQGYIPPTFRNLRGLKELDLSSNNLSGPFPDFLADFPYLQLVNLSFNDLSGEVPKEGVFLNSTALKVSGNENLCGGISNLDLPPCSTGTTHKKDTHLLVKVLVPVVCGILLLTLLVLVCITQFSKIKARKNNSFNTSIGDFFFKVSYADLVKATDDFSFENLIGVGTYGSVFKGTLSNGEFVAVKVLNLEQQGAFKSFMAECEALRNIRHRNLVKILTACSSVDATGSEFRALVFEFMPNGNLDRWLHPEVGDEKVGSGSLSLDERVNIAIDVATALNYLHHDCEVPVVHCDLKPSNVLLDDDMTAHVGDFGLARFLRRGNVKLSRESTSSVAVKGSIGYVPPEYGMGSHVSTQGDVYSYGIVLLELFTGKRPTNDMFKDGLTLQSFIEEEISKGSKATQIMDPSLLRKDISNTSERTEKILYLILKVGLSCAKPRPRDRIKMKDVVSQLTAVKEFILS